MTEGTTIASIEDRVRGVLASIFALQPSDIGPDTSTDTVERWDSLQQLTVIVSLEEEFGIGFTDDETVTLVNFPLIVAIVADHLGVAQEG